MINIKGTPKYFIDRYEVVSDDFLVWGWTYTEDENGGYKTCNMDVSVSPSSSKDKVRLTRMYREDVDAHLHAPAEVHKWSFLVTWPLSMKSDVVISFLANGKSKKLKISKELQEAYEREAERYYKTEAEWRKAKDSQLKKDEFIFATRLEKRHREAIHERRLEKKIMISYDKWRKKRLLTDKELRMQRETHFEYEPKISIIVPAYRTPKKFLGEMIDSVRNQTYANWELCIADASMDDSIVYELERYNKLDQRIVYSVLDENYGISGNTNEAIKIATGDYISLLDHDDLLTPDALYEVVKRINETKADVLYTDEDKVSFELDYYFEPHFKPDFNLDYLRSCNYICHFFIVKKEILDKVGMFDPECDGSQDYDFILRCTGVADRVEHIAKCLYNWRCHPNSTAMNPESKLYCYTAGKRALEKHLVLCGVENVEVQIAENYGYYKALYQMDGNPKLSVIVINGEKFECDYENIEVVSAQIDWNELEKKLPEYISKVDGDYVFIVFGDTVCASNNGMELLIANMQREGIEAVGCKVLDKYENIVECGRIACLSGEERMMFRGLHRDFHGYGGRGLSQQELTTIGMDGLMIRKESGNNIFNKDEYQRKDGKIVFCPYVHIEKIEDYIDPLSHEDVILQDDKFYNINFNLEGKQFQW